MYNQNEKAILWLNSFPFLSIEKRHAILQFYDYPQDIFATFPSDYDFLKQLITVEQFDTMKQCLNDTFIDSEIVKLDAKNIKAITYVSKDYPQDFLNYHHYPLCLYAIGDISLLNSFSIAVVGTRKITKYGKFVTEKIVRDLAQSGVTIISGMAMGVDSVAHNTCLSCGGKTIAVLGSGFNNVFPKSNFELFKQICATGLVLSEYSPDTPPLAYNFPIRNRIIALLSHGVLMTEAGLKSGAIYTINYGIEYGKEIFAVPGNIDNFSSQGTNNVLKNCQAGLVTSAEDILNVFSIENKSQKQQKNKQFSLDEQIILNAIGGDELSFDEIQEKTKFDTKILVRLLTTLELSGIIKKSVGNFYSIIYS